MKSGVLILLFVSLSLHVYSQCCSAGSGSPIAGGTSQGVLQDRQAEVNLNFQHASSNKFLNGDKKDDKFLDYFGSNFAYLRLSYGITSKLTLSVESGYYIDKTEVGLDGGEKIQSHGLSDLIIFPRYTVYSRNKEQTREEVTLGVGYKLPIGKYNDSLRQVETFTGEEFYITKPPGVQPTTGSHDFIFYLFAFRGYPYKNFRVFSNLLYIKKGWNPEGLKYGDYASVSLFASKTLLRKVGVTLQLKGEWIDEMKYNENLQTLGYYNFDVNATGTKKVSVVPQLSYSVRNFTIYALSEFPLYQYVNKRQVASQRMYTAGFSYRFLTYKNSDSE
jgi:hypothetical protein